MSDDKQALTGQQIHDEGLDGWRKVLDRLTVRYDTGDFNAGTALVTEIAQAADEADHHPDVELRYPHVTVSLKSHDVGAITARDIRLARRISELAAARGVSASAHAPDVLELALDTSDQEAIKPFWAAILGYDAGDDEVTDSASRLPSVWFQPSDSTAPGPAALAPRRQRPPRRRAGAHRRGRRRRRHPGQRRARAGVLGACRLRGQPGLHLHVGEPGLTRWRCSHGPHPRPTSGRATTS